MLLLLLDVGAHRLKIRGAYRKITVSRLPCKVFNLRETALNPKVGNALQFLDQIGLGNIAAQLKQDMDMIGNAANQNGWTIQLFGDPSNKCMNLLTNHPIRQEWKPVFRRENEMQKDAG